MTPEGKIKQKVSALLKSYGDRVYYNMPVPGGYGESMLDYVICANGAFAMVETKRPTKEPTPRQHVIRRMVEQAGGIVFRVNDDDSLQAFKDWLDVALGVKHADLRTA
jgi:hypothetical protein